MTTAFVLPDEEARERIRTDVRANMCVEAGAGTGKTTVLVDRIVHILASGHADVHHLAVITFTEKAAAELAGRVRRGLEDALDKAGDPQQRERIGNALRGLNHAHIETIHAFASALLRERPVEAALDPGFEVLQELPAQLAFESAWNEWLGAEMAADDPPQALIDALNLGLQFERVREAAEELNRNRELRPLAPYDVREVDAPAVVRDLGVLAAELQAFTPHCIDPEDKGLAEIVRIAALHAELAALDGHADAQRRTLAQSKKVAVNAGNQKCWRTAQHMRDVKVLFKRALALLEGARGDMRGAATARLLHWLEGFVRAYDEQRKRAGQADFDDLLLWARDLVRNDAVRAYFQDRYRCILVDEFQDTDPLQVEIIVALCAEGALPADWRRATLRTGSLFVVGDPKQSIYRFRGADITMYDDVKAHIFGDAPVRITQNFRSGRPVIDWANATFEQLLVRREGMQPEHVALEFLPRYAGHGGVAVLTGEAPPTEHNQSKANALRTFEGERLAAFIGDAVRQGTLRVRDDAAPEDGAVPLRPATYRDIVVIIPLRTELHLYEDAFARAGVPYRHEGGRTFFQRQEVRELIAVLRAIDDPGDGVAAIAALRSPAFGCSDEELLLHRAAHNGFDYASLKTGAEGPVADAMRVLARLAKMRHERTLPDLLRAVLDETRLVEFAMLQPQGEQVAANLLKMIDQARTFADASGRGLRGFVRWLKENIARTSDETDAPISEETDDVVRILTVHAAKGLEFPVVVFANMNTLRLDRTKVIRDRAANRLHVKLGKREELFLTPGYEEAELLEKEHGEAEEKRLLYVAATRAKDHLVLPFFEGSSGKDCLNDLLRKTGAHLAPTHDLAQLPAVAGDLPIWRRDPAAGDDASVAAVIADRDAWLASHAELVKAAKAPLLIRTASALKPEWERVSAGEEAVVRRGRATDFGSAVHALIERTELTRAGDIGKLASAVAEEFGQQGREAEMSKLARRALQSPAVKRALASPRMLLEAPFVAALPAGGLTGLAEGRIDLLFEEDGGIVIADFKTDAIAEGEVEARAAHYRNQALVYAWAARAATGMPVREVVFIFMQPDREHTFAVDAAFLAEAEALIATAPPADEELAAV